MAQELTAKYGNLHAFNDTFCPAAMPIIAENPGRAYNGTAPTLEVVMIAFGADAVTAWLYTLVDYFVQYCGASLSSMQMMDVARRLSVKSHLKVTEYLLFFWRLGNAEYGRVYKVDTLFIMDSFNQFFKQRVREREEYAVTTTDDVSASSDWPVIKPSEFYRIAMEGGCINPEAGRIALEELGPY